MIKQFIVPTNFRNYCTILFCVTLLSAELLFNVSNARAQTLLTTIPLGPEAGSGFIPEQVVVNTATNLIYISNLKKNSISVVDGKSNKVIDNFKTGRIGGMDINAKTNRLYLVTLDGVNVIDGDTNEIITTISTVGNLGWPITVNSTTNLIYVTNRDRGTICVIDGETNTIVDTIRLDNDVDIIEMAVNPVTNQIYGVCPDDNIMVIDGETNRVIDIVEVGGRLSKVAVNPSTNRIYVQSNSSKTKESIIKVINGETNRVVDKITLEGFVNGIDVNHITNNIYATIAFELEFGVVNIIDGESNKVVDVVTVGTSPTGVAVNTVTSAVYVTNIQDDSVSVIDGESNTIRDTVQIGEFLHGGIGINYETNRVYVGSWSSKSILVIDGSTNEVIDSVRVAVSPFGVPVGVGVNSATNLIYVPIGNDNIVAVIDGSTNKVVENIKDRKFSGIEEIGVNPVTNRIYVSSFRGVSVIDGNSNRVIDFIEGVKPPEGIAVNTVTNIIYVVKPPNSVHVIDGGINRIIDNVRLTNVGNVEGIAVNSITNRIYLGSFIAILLTLKAEGISKKLGIPKAAEAALCVINGETNKVMKCLESPVSTVIGVNPATNHIFVANSSNISVIDGAKNTVVADIDVEDGSKQAIGINPVSNLIYITNSDTGNVTVIKDDLE